MLCSCAPDGAAATAARPDEPRPKTTRSLPDTVTDGDVLEDEARRTFTGVLRSTPAKAVVTAATSLRGQTRTWIAEGMCWPATVRHATSWVSPARLWSRIRLAPEVHVTREPPWVSTKVSRTSPVAVPGGTLVTAVAVLADAKVVDVPTWVMVAVVVDASRRGVASAAAATRMMPIDAPMMRFQPRESAG